MGKGAIGSEYETPSAARDAWRRLVDFALPPACPLTGERVAEPGTLAPEVWRDLRFVTRPYCAVTGAPFEVDLGDDTVSALALARPPAYDRARSVLLYEGAGQRLVHLLKYSDRQDLAPLLARLMRQAGHELLADADMVAPVPLHRRRLFERRFNQAALLAQLVGEGCGVPVDAGLLQRTRRTPSQVGLSRAGRRRNVRGAFAVRPVSRESVRGARIVLVDDVLTSGATAEACAAVLKRMGAARVDVLTLARVVRPEDVTI